MGNIFTEGDTVKIFHIPYELKVGEYFKKLEWAADALKNYVSQFFGDELLVVNPPAGRNGRVTGTSIVIIKNGKKTTYMLVEPTKRYNLDILVKRMEEDLDEQFNHIFEALDIRRAGKQPLDNPFASLADIKNNLPKKAKNQGAPKARKYRW